MSKRSSSLLAWLIRSDASGGLNRAPGETACATRTGGGGSSRFMRRLALVTRSKRLGMRLFGLAGAGVGAGGGVMAGRAAGASTGFGAMKAPLPSAACSAAATCGGSG